MHVSGPAVYGQQRGDAERRLRAAFSQARRLAKANATSQTSVLVLDDVEWLGKVGDGPLGSDDRCPLLGEFPLRHVCTMGLGRTGPEQATRLTSACSRRFWSCWMRAPLVMPRSSSWA